MTRAMIHLEEPVKKVGNNESSFNHRDMKLKNEKCAYKLIIQSFIIFKDDNARGVSDLWSNVNHIALVVSDVGTSLSFYTDVVGFQHVMRPNFDRYAAKI